MSPFYVSDDTDTGTTCIRYSVDNEEHIIKTGMTPSQADELQQLLSKAYLFGIAVARVKQPRSLTSIELESALG